MPKQVKLRRGTTAQHATFAGALGEVTFDTSKKAIVCHDGATAGGFPLALESVQIVKTGASFGSMRSTATIRRACVGGCNCHF